MPSVRQVQSVQPIDLIASFRPNTWSKLCQLRVIDVRCWCFRTCVPDLPRVAPSLYISTIIWYDPGGAASFYFFIALEFHVWMIYPSFANEKYFQNYWQRPTLFQSPSALGETSSSCLYLTSFYKLRACKLLLSIAIFRLCRHISSKLSCRESGRQ